MVTLISSIKKSINATVIIWPAAQAGFWIPWTGYNAKNRTDVQLWSNLLIKTVEGENTRKKEKEEQKENKIIVQVDLNTTSWNCLTTLDAINSGNEWCEFRKRK
jgi:hypothetical protein